MGQGQAHRHGEKGVPRTDMDSEAEKGKAKTETEEKGEPPRRMPVVAAVLAVGYHPADCLFCAQNGILRSACAGKAGGDGSAHHPHRCPGDGASDGSRWGRGKR